MGSQQTFQPTYALIKKPENYPTDPTPGKLQILWDVNSKSLYHRLSPYTDYDMTLLSKVFGSKQPFYYVYADEEGKGLPGLRKYESRMFPIGSAPIDVIRISKFLVSAGGIKFLAKQFLLQTGNAFNETRIYNPTSPIVAAGMGLALGSIRPQRAFDTSGGLVGLARTLIGNSIPDAIFGAPKISKPSGTAPQALTDDTYVKTQTTGGKGLVRAGTAESAKGHLNTAWVNVDSKGGGITNSFKTIVKNLVGSLFANFISKNQNDIKYRSDEGTYGLMLGGGKGRFDYNGATRRYEFGQMWIAGDAGKKTIRPNKEIPNSYVILKKYDKGSLQSIPASSIYTDIPNLVNGQVGYAPGPSMTGKPGRRYSDAVGESISTRNGDFYTNSDVMLQYKEYSDPAQPFSTKNPESNKVTKTNDSLRKVISDINKNYVVTVTDDSSIIKSGNVNYDYNRLFNTNKQKDSALNYPLGVLKQYRDSNVNLVSNNIANDQKSYRLPTFGHSDGINMLQVLDKDKKIINSNIKGWNTWDPYKDDLIALYFYDVVNEKYIPFRAAIKSLSESGNASWEEMQFIGRADKLYSYGGFNRVLNMNIHIVISSIVELLPTWQRINYITTAIKPGNYTKAKYELAGNAVTDRFLVPPMFMITVGDLYKEQPILIQSITCTIPDDASWETINDRNSDYWNYLAGIINSPILYGQLPREVELSFNLILLEKERAVVGGANFGHAPRKDAWTDDWTKDPWNVNTVTGNDMSELHKNMVVNVIDIVEKPKESKNLQYKMEGLNTNIKLDNFKSSTPPISPPPSVPPIVPMPPNTSVYPVNYGPTYLPLNPL